MRPLILTLVLFSFAVPFAAKADAIYDPLATSNNKFGVHIISATPHESSPAASMVNSQGGDWGYVTITIQSSDRDSQKWQGFFDDLRRRHLIPLVRIATQPEGNFWKRPAQNDISDWADFLDGLYWPTKNRYVIIYNEPNQAKEWGNSVMAKSYAQTLDWAITVFKNKNPDFFVLNAGLDASAPQKLPAYQDEAAFLKDMDEAVPGIFNKLDGWVSHSYPNPNFSGSPDATGKGSVRTWAWELSQLKSLGLTKNLPIFITETGWKHAEGINYNPDYPSADQVGLDYKKAFQTAWNDPKIVAVTPFLLSYQEEPFDHFSFKKYTGEVQSQKILGAEYPDYYPQYQVLMQLPKVTGTPLQENKAQLQKGEIYSNIVYNQTYTIPLTIKNVGQSIWGERGAITLVPNDDGKALGIQPVALPKGVKVEPGQNYTFNFNITAPQSGKFNVALNLFAGDRQFDSNPFVFTVSIKPPVVLRVHSVLQWKKNPAGDYVLSVAGALKDSITRLVLDGEGKSGQLEAAYLLPGYSFDFTLNRPFYKPKTIRQTVNSGVNDLDFGELKPDISSAILNPQALWSLLPFSN